MDNLQAIMPMLIVTLAAMATMLAEAFRRKDERMPIGGLGVIGLVGAIAAAGLLWDRNAVGFGVIQADNFSLFVTVVVAVIGLFTIMFSSEVVEREGIPSGEYYTLTLFSVVGMMMMASATDLLVIFIALEIMSIAVYVLTGIKRTDAAGTEASFKYFLLGSFSSAFFLYGIAFSYAVSGSTRLDALSTAIAQSASAPGPMVWLAMGLLLVGFAFKVSAVPFHMWTPDAYEGAPTVVTGFMSTGVKAAAVAAFLRVFLSAFEPLRGDWTQLLTWIAMLTMVVGTVVGVAQTNVKRMLAYSSIAHAGYLLAGIIAASAIGKSAVLFYLASYAVANVGAFGVIAFIATRERNTGELTDFTGLWYAKPMLAVLMAVFLLSLGGFPPMAGFIAKWYIFAAAVNEGFYTLAIVGVLTSVVSVFFYLRIVVMMFMSSNKAELEVPPFGIVGTLGLALAAIATFYLGILPTRLIDLATQSISTIF
ncbi:MAG: NADH-quinone oxidoreductase subunit N [Acidobacteria bacterium]|jgi:NADH-quinone oxidoreductase subunit N|nr:NADH-quinone oxidoreductase subunit N [Acidobacteriota bacterium]